MASDYKILESKVYKVGGKEYHKLDFTAKQGTFTLRFIQYYFATPSNVFTVTLTTELDKYEHYKEEGLKMLDTFIPL
jgi:hypothetical protein